MDIDPASGPWLAVLVPSLAAAFSAWLRYRNQQKHREAILALAANNPQLALQMLERMAPPVGQGTAPLILLLLGACAGLLSCVPGVHVQRRMVSLSEAAVARCEAQRSACDQALRCARAAKDAGVAVQDARALAAKGQSSTETTVRSVALLATADAQCAQAGIRVTP